MEAFIQVISEAKANISDIDGLCSNLNGVFPPASYFSPVSSGYTTLVEEFNAKEWGKAFDSAVFALSDFGHVVEDAQFLLRFIMGLLYFRRSNFGEAFGQFSLSDKLCRKLYGRDYVVSFVNLASHEAEKYWNDVEKFIDQTTEMHAVLDTLFSKILDRGGPLVSRALTSFKDEKWKEAVVCVNLVCARRCGPKKEYLDLCLMFLKGLLHYRRNRYALAYKEFLSCDNLCIEIFQSTFFKSFIAYASNGLKNYWDGLEEHINQTAEMHQVFVELFSDILDGKIDKHVNEALVFFKKEKWKEAAMSVLKAIVQRGQKSEYLDLCLRFFYCFVSNRHRKKDLDEKHFQKCLELKTHLNLPFPSVSFFEKMMGQKQKVPGEAVPPSSTSASSIISHRTEGSSQVPPTHEPLLSSQSLGTSPRKEESVQVLAPPSSTLASSAISHKTEDSVQVHATDESLPSKQPLGISHRNEEPV